MIIIINTYAPNTRVPKIQETKSDSIRRNRNTPLPMMDEATRKKASKKTEDCKQLKGFQHSPTNSRIRFVLKCR
jgi:hypothetical protein